MVLLQSEFDKKKKSKTTAYLFWFFTGAFGGHRFYAGDALKGILMLITFGGIGIWAFIDVFFIGKRIEDKNQLVESEILQQTLTLDPAIENKQVAATLK